MVGPSDYTAREAVPAPTDGRVEVKQAPGGYYAARAFNGRAEAEEVAQQRQAMLAALERDGLSAEAKCTVARYNDPSKNPLLRRNEVLA